MLKQDEPPETALSSSTRNHRCVTVGPRAEPLGRRALVHSDSCQPTEMQQRYTAVATTRRETSDTGEPWRQTPLEVALCRQPAYRNDPRDHNMQEESVTMRRLPIIDSLRANPTKPTMLVLKRPLSMRALRPPPSESKVVETRSPSSASGSDGENDKEQDDETQEQEPMNGKKRQRYLRDVDRRSIILRIERGEKQAALAREFGVTRAAICHINKNRDEIISRYDLLLKSAKEMERAGVMSSMEDEPPLVQQLTKQSVLMLLTTLRDVTTPPKAFRLSANRLMMILLEEVLACVPTVECDLRTTRGDVLTGVKADPKLCCIALGQKGVPLLRLYHQCEPHGSIGCVHLRYGTFRGQEMSVDRLDLPDEMTPESPVLLFACTSGRGRSISAALRRLVDVGVLEENIRVVLLACTATAIEKICGEFPGIRVLACVIEQNQSTTTTLGDFMARYNAARVEAYDQPPGASPLPHRSHPPRNSFSRHHGREPVYRQEDTTWGNACAFNRANIRLKP